MNVCIKYKLESKDDLKKIDIKKRTCYYFDDIIKDTDINFGNVLLDEKPYEKILVYDISYKTSKGPKPLRIMFDKIGGFIRVRVGKFRPLYLLFDYGLFDKICDRIKYLTSENNVITDSINHNFGKLRIDSYNSLPIAKVLTFHNLIILIKSVANKNKNNYYYNIFSEKDSNKDKSDTQ